ncbi:MAG: AAA family ATPase [Verrucomicrobia bacterium]|jgi:predicted ATPase|nr:AAA family ATPase [Verrucomicrobiota bacterium]
MIKYLELKNVGPAPEMSLDFEKRLNLITGDNGLGKSFILDIAWWSMTRKWPNEANPRLTTGKKAIPSGSGEASISFAFTGKAKLENYLSTYQRKEQSWTGRAGRPANPGLVLYAMSDGSFGVWDPARNYWKTQEGVDIQERPPAYVFSPTEIWDGLPEGGTASLCNGLIRDWASWQKEKGNAFKHLKQVLKNLSPSHEEKIEPGSLTRISLDDVRDMPTIKAPYEKEIPIVHASSGIKRIVAMAYLLVWSWEEHQRAAKLLGDQPTKQIVFLIDELESHLHPSWQRKIMPSLLEVMKGLSKKTQVQLVTATHSPLIMASAEPLFDSSQDAWFDLDLEDGEVVSRKREFIRRGDVKNWLTSEAFDLKSTYSLEAEQVLEKATETLSNESLDANSAKQLDADLRKVLSDTDPFWMRWRFVAEKKGWLQ